jgi:hypothetical protein
MNGKDGRQNIRVLPLRNSFFVAPFKQESET